MTLGEHTLRRLPDGHPLFVRRDGCQVPVRLLVSCCLHLSETVTAEMMRVVSCITVFITRYNATQGSSCWQSRWSVYTEMAYKSRHRDEDGPQAGTSLMWRMKTSFPNYPCPKASVVRKHVNCLLPGVLTTTTT